MNKAQASTRLLVVLAFLSLVGCAPTALAARFVDVSIVDRTTGERLTPYRHEGRLYVAGTPGDRYAVELRSVRGERVLTVLAVDGVNVLTGQTAASLQSGYVLDGGQSYAVSGWRKSMDEVAQFVFTDLPNSYAARSGRPSNVGVIGVAVFREKQVSRAPAAIAPQSRRIEEGSPAFDKNETEAAGRLEPGRADARGAAQAADALAERRADAASEGDAIAAPKLKKAGPLGTGHGDREYAPTRYTEFVRNSDTPDEIVTIYYDSRANLIARGIIAAPRFAEPARPLPFPAGAGFVPDPQG